MRLVALLPTLTVLAAVLTVASVRTAEAQSGSVLWSHEIGGQLWAPLAHHEGTLYFGSDDGSFYAFEVPARDVSWRFVTKGKIRSGAVFAGGKVFFASDDGFLYALMAESGKQVWRFDLGSGDLGRVLPATDPPYEYDYLHSTPVHHEGRIYIGSASGALYAVDAETGAESWRFATEGKIRSTPAVYGGTAIFGSWDGHVYAVSLDSGEEIWRYDTGGIVQGSPAVSSDRVFVGSRSAAVFALDARSGEQVWKHSHADGSWVESSPVLANGVVYIGSSDARKLFAFDAATGQTIWEFETGGWSWSTPELAGDVVYIGGLSASPYYFEGVVLQRGLHAVARSTGESLWEFASELVEGYITGGVFSTPVVVDGVVYAGALDGRLYALRE